MRTNTGTRRTLLVLLIMSCSSAVSAIDIQRVPPPTMPTPPLVFSAGFSDGAVLQRGDAGTAVYGFVSEASAVKVTVSGDADYVVNAQVSEWVDDSGCNASACPDPRTRPMPAHGGYVWRAQLQAQPKAGGDYSISVASAAAGANGTIRIANLTFGDVYFCSGQSNMDLEIYFTFSVDELKAQMQGGKYANLRTFEYGYMSGGIQAEAPQYVTTWYSQNSWQKVSESSLVPSGPPGGYSAHSPWARFSATCMYFVRFPRLNLPNLAGLGCAIVVLCLQRVADKTARQRYAAYPT